jgi:putative tryptophan/tyrosine transport system substrate-binding protein
MIARRTFIAGLGAAAAWPFAARAQQPTMRGIGYLGAGSPQPIADLIEAFRKGLGATGYVEGQNLAIEFRWAHGDYGRLPELATDLVHRRVAVLVAPQSVAAALAAKAATTTIPIVFSGGDDPVKAGLIASFNRPGGNVTGFGFMSVEAMAKRIGLLHELLPGATRFVALVNPTSPITEAIVEYLRTAASALGVRIEVLNAATNRDIDGAFAMLAQNPADALMVSPDTLFFIRRVQIVTLAASYRVPTIYYDPAFTEIGGLMSYGTSIPEVYRQTGVYVGRILKGEKPADMPFQQATKFDLVVNLGTAHAIGLTVPATLLSTADKVIE